MKLTFTKDAAKKFVDFDNLAVIEVLLAAGWSCDDLPTQEADDEAPKRRGRPKKED